MLYGRLAGTFLSAYRDSRGVVLPMSGYIEITPNSTSILTNDITGKTTVLPGLVKIPLVDGKIMSGSLPYIELLASSQPNMSPAVFSYKAAFVLTVNATKVRYDPFSFLLPAWVSPNPPVNLTTVAPVPNAIPSGITKGDQGLQGIQGLTGPVGPRGLQGLIGPRGQHGTYRFHGDGPPGNFPPNWMMNI